MIFFSIYDNILNVICCMIMCKVRKHPLHHTYAEVDSGNSHWRGALKRSRYSSHFNLEYNPLHHTYADVDSGSSHWRGALKRSRYSSHLNFIYNPLHHTYAEVAERQTHTTQNRAGNHAGSNPAFGTK